MTTNTPWPCSAGVLSRTPDDASGESARVRPAQKAASVSTFQSDNEDVGDFVMVITPRPNQSLTDLEAAADAVIAKLKADGPRPDEIQRATAGIELAFLNGLQSDLGKAFQLADGAPATTATPGYFATNYEKSRAVTAADVKRVANKYLTNGRVILSIVPMGKLELASKPNESKKAVAEHLRRGRSREVCDEGRRDRAIARVGWTLFAALMFSAAPGCDRRTGVTSIAAQQTLDRNTVPPAGKPAPALHVPDVVDRATLEQRRAADGGRAPRVAAGRLHRSPFLAAPISSKRPTHRGEAPRSRPR